MKRRNGLGSPYVWSIDGNYITEDSLNLASYLTEYGTRATIEKYDMSETAIRAVVDRFRKDITLRACQRLGLTVDEFRYLLAVAKYRPTKRGCIRQYLSELCVEYDTYRKFMRLVDVDLWTMACPIPEMFKIRLIRMVTTNENLKKAVTVPHTCMCRWLKKYGSCEG